MSADPTSYELAFETRFSKKNHDARRDIGRTKKIRTNKPANPSGLPNRILVALSWNLKPGCILRINLSLAERSIKSCPRRCDTGEDAIQEMPGQPSRSRTSAGAELISGTCASEGRKHFGFTKISGHSSRGIPHKFVSGRSVRQVSGRSARQYAAALREELTRRRLHHAPIEWHSDE